MKVADLAVTRREVLGFGGLGLALASVDGLIPRAFASTGKVTPRGTARNVIFFEISGAISHVESFDFGESGNAEGSGCAASGAGSLSFPSVVPAAGKADG